MDKIDSIHICETCNSVTVTLDNGMTTIWSTERFNEVFFEIRKLVGCNYCYGNHFEREEVKDD